MKKLRKFAAASAGTMLAVSALAAPQIAGATPDAPGTTQGPENDAEGEPGAEDSEISFESSQNSEINPGQTLTLSPDESDDGVFIETINADPDFAGAWQAEGVEETGEVKITAPAAPDEQEDGVDVDYGEYDFTLVTNTGFEYELTLNFVAAENDDDTQPEPQEPSSVADIREQLRNLSSNLSSS